MAYQISLNPGAGLIEECDSPTQLLENKSSSFAQLVAEYTVRSNSSFG
jgi:ATP-binding cassette subfamily C (CFTR/MRP) protein 2